MRKIDTNGINQFSYRFMSPDVMARLYLCNVTRNIVIGGWVHRQLLTFRRVSVDFGSRLAERPSSIESIKNVDGGID
ncbi:hypothetical protein OAH34_02470 [bacterium]|nr:hypothetical protein [bacterium]